MFRFALLSTLLQVACSKQLFSQPSALTLPKSKATNSILSRARRLADGDDDAVDYTWMEDYTIKFERCFPNDYCQNDDGGECQSLVLFSLCPADSTCASGCAYGAEYVVDMYYFIDAFTEAQLGAKEYACEMAREYCEDADDDGCYGNYGANDCDEEQDGNFNLQKYLECNEFGDDYYLAPYCSDDGENIYLGIFSDDTCTTQESDDTFENAFGYELDYSYTSQYSIVTDECAYCKEHAGQQDQNEGDQEDEDNVLEQCEDLYAAAKGCEQNLNVDNPNNDYCDYIDEVKSAYAKYEGEGEERQRRGVSPGKVVLMVLLIGAAILGCCWCIGKKKAAESPLLGTSPGVA